VDPARDTPEVLRHYLHPYPTFLGLTGDAAQVDKAKAAFRVFARRASDPDEPDGYRVPHTAIAYFLGANGHCLAHFADALCAEEVLGRMRQLLETQIRQFGD
jgi:protein SCO1/2